MNHNEQIKNIIVELDKLGYNPFEIKSMFNNVVDDYINETAESKYIKVVFDSPEGAFSKKRLEANGYTAVNWYGHDGCRGETTVYIPKDTDIDEFKMKLKEWNVIDEYSVVNVK